MIRLSAIAIALVAFASSPVQVITQGHGAARVVALTFDAGADRGFALQILKTLERNHMQATFGMTGLWAQKNKDLVQRMARDNDRFINHTYDHRSFTGYSSGAPPLSIQQRTWEIEETDRILRATTGRSTRPYFRPPYGDYDGATLALIGKLGYRYMVMWTVDSLGWDHLSAPTIEHRCLALTRPGTILLMHVGSQSQDAVALQGVITGLQRQGYRFVTVPELLGRH